MGDPFTDRRRTDEEITAAINANLAKMGAIREQMRRADEDHAKWVADWKAERDALRAEREAMGDGVSPMLARVRALLPVPYLED